MLETKRLSAVFGLIEVLKIAPANESERISEDPFVEKRQIQIGGYNM